MYHKGKRTEPFAQNDNQDMWLQEIDFVIETGDEWPRVINHSGCIEIRAESEDLLDTRTDVDAKRSRLDRLG